MTAPGTLCFAVIVTVYLAFCRDFTAARMHIDLASSCHHQVYVRLQAVCVGIVLGATELGPRRPIFFTSMICFMPIWGKSVCSFDLVKELACFDVRVSAWLFPKHGHHTRWREPIRGTFPL